MLSLPIETADSESGSSFVTPLHKLMVIRCLRPDRFVTAMRVFVEKDVGNLIEGTLPPFEEVLSGIKHSIPVFVQMPNHSSVIAPFKIRPVDKIKRLAEVRKEITKNRYLGAKQSVHYGCCKRNSPH